MRPPHDRACSSESSRVGQTTWRPSLARRVAALLNGRDGQDAPGAAIVGLFDWGGAGVSANYPPLRDRVEAKLATDPAPLSRYDQPDKRCSAFDAVGA